MKHHAFTLADHHTPPPPLNGIQFFRFRMFLPKSAHIRGRHPPPQRLSAPQWEILETSMIHAQKIPLEVVTDITSFMLRSFGHIATIACFISFTGGSSILHQGVATSSAGALQQKYSKELGPVGLAVGGGGGHHEHRHGLIWCPHILAKNSLWPILGEIG